MNNNDPRLLVIGPTWVGDMMMSQVLFKLLKQQHPNSMLDVVAPAWSGPLLARMPEVNASISSPFQHGEFSFKKRYQFGVQLRNKHYDQVFVIPNSWKSAVIPFAAKIPKRTGWLGEQRWCLLNDVRRFDKTYYPLMIQKIAALAFPENAALPKVLPIPSFTTQAENVSAAQQKFNLFNTEKPILAVCAGAEFGPSKRWLPSYFAQVAQAKLREGWQIWLFGSPKDKVVSEEIQAYCQNQCTDLTGVTSLAEAVDLISLTSMIVTNDSGLMHIGAALEKPLIALYGSTSPSFTPPLGKQVKILQLDLECSPCFKRECPLQHHRCMRELKPSQVLAAMDKFNGNSPTCAQN